MKRIVFLSFCVVMSMNLMAQRPAQKLEAQKVAFITQRLNLTPEEAQQFWPVFNQYTEKLQQIRSVKSDNKPLDEMTESETEKSILADLDKDSRELDLKKEYYQKLKKVISVKKVAKLYRAERDFKTMLLERIQQNRENRKAKQNGN